MESNEKIVIVKTLKTKRQTTAAAAAARGNIKTTARSRQKGVGGTHKTKDTRQTTAHKRHTGIDMRQVAAAPAGNKKQELRGWVGNFRVQLSPVGE
ncbi:hypothetical protein E2C01_017800 [Portunus trituberculatus]|uniref:Uncharacterized protein n=1 Tax=Portunus trituberculatus TaxID=210409 RepID=A0A5B7DSX7_PORTR|nr:hypothetical protein [Portunus trituberculatus]